MEISSDNGNTWIPQCGKYTRKGIETHDYALDEPLYDGNRPQWINESILLTDYLGDEIFLRFKLYTDGGLRRDGFYFDNFKIKGLTENLNVSEIQQYDSRIYPNPANDYINVVSKNKINRLEIYDVIGKKLLEEEGLNISRISLPMSNPGIYILRLYSESGTENHKIIKK